MKWSKYNIFFEYNQNWYLYNTLTSGIAIVTSDVFMCLQNDQLPAQNEIVEALYQQKYIVDDEDNELSYYKYYYNSHQYKEEAVLKITIIPTYICNLNCSYCYQGCDSTDKNCLSRSSCAAIIKFILYEIKHRISLKELQLSFYGGEPLICEHIIIELADEIRNIALQYNLKYTSFIITNATLITQTTIDKLFRPNDMKIQITIDGLKNTHDVRRKYKNGNPSFDCIISALNLLKGNGLKDNIIIRVNIDKYNDNEIREIIYHFHDLAGEIYFSPLLTVGNYSCGTSSCIEKNNFLTDYYYEITSILEQYGVVSDIRTFGKKKPCAFNKNNSFIIDQSLNIYKCLGFVGDVSFCVGSIDSDGQLKKNCNFFIQSTWTPLEFTQCTECSLLPACASGCPYEAHVNNLTFNEPYCEIDKPKIIERLKKYLAYLSAKVESEKL